MVSPGFYYEVLLIKLKFSILLDKYQMIVSALAMQIASAINTTASRDDDILAAIQQLSNPSKLYSSISSWICGVKTVTGVEHGVLSEVYRALSLSADYSFDSQQDKLARNLNLLRCFSLQESFGHHLERSHRNLTSKVAKTTMDFRLITLIFAFAFISSEIKSPTGQVISNDVIKPGIVFSLFFVDRVERKLYSR